MMELMFAPWAQVSTKPKYKQVIDVYFNKISRVESMDALSLLTPKDGAYILYPKG
jgi:Fe-S cluster assembly protein SufD